MDISYIIVFTILIIGVAIWQLNQSRPRQFILSEQLFPELSLLVLIEKKDRKIHQIIVRVRAKKDVSVSRVRCELISEKRDFTYLELSEINGSAASPFPVAAKNDAEVALHYDKLKESLADKPMNTFRFIVEVENGKTFKSHELAFNKYWKVYKADTGKYN